jgi:secondary thiamine-phosphate synthase enzyme
VCAKLRYLNSAVGSAVFGRTGRGIWRPYSAAEAREARPCKLALQTFRRGAVQHQETIEVRTRGRTMVDVTRDVARIVGESRIRTGLCIVYCPHTSCSLLIQENADEAVREDLFAWLERLAPDGDPRYTHTAEGPDDMPSHVKSALTSASLGIPIVGGRLALGTWQGIFLWEHREKRRSREIVVHVGA